MRSLTIQDAAQQGPAFNIARDDRHRRRMTCTMLVHCNGDKQMTFGEQGFVAMQIGLLPGSDFRERTTRLPGRSV